MRLCSVASKGPHSRRELFELVLQLGKLCTGNPMQSGNDGTDGYYGGTKKDQEDEYGSFNAPNVVDPSSLANVASVSPAQSQHYPSESRRLKNPHQIGG